MVKAIKLFAVLWSVLLGSLCFGQSGVSVGLGDSLYRNTLGTRLRYRAAVAASGNAWTRPYYKSVPPWQPSTLYYQYQSVVNGGNIYYTMFSSGTSASSGGPTGTGNTYAADGSTFWIYYGPNVITQDPGTTQTAWAASTAYSLAAQVTNGGNVYACVAAGTSAGSGGPSGASNSITDNTATWTYMGAVRATTYAGDFPTITASTTRPSGSFPNFYGTNTGPAFALQRAFVLNAGRGYAVNDTITMASNASTLTGGISAVSVAAGGSGYAQGDISIFATGFGTSLKVLITSVSGGVVTGVSLYQSGVYTTSAPSSPASQTGNQVGTGSGLTVNLTTANGGLSTTPVTLTVTSVSGGAVIGVSVTTPGAYTSLPQAQLVQASTSGSGSGATFAANWPAPSWCRLRGCYNGGTVNSGDQQWIQPYSFQPTPGAAPNNLQPAIEFWSDAPKLYFGQYSGNKAGLNIIIDGVRYTPGFPLYNNSSNNYLTIDWSTTSGRKRRFYRIEGNLALTMSGVGVDTSSQVWAPDKLDDVRAVAISDSIWAGNLYSPFVPGNGAALRLGHALGWNDVWSFTQGGTGWVNRGASPGVTTDAFGTRIAEALTLNPDVWLIMGSTNDAGSFNPSSYAVGATTTVNTSVPHGLSAGQSVTFSAATGTGSAINGTSYAVTITSTTQFTVPFNSTGLTLTGGSFVNSATGHTIAQDNVTAGLKAIRTGGSTAPIVVFGLWSANVTNGLATEQAIQSGVTAAADPLGLTTFIPIWQDPSFPWISGTWNNNPSWSGITNTNSTNASQYVAGDNLHPNDPGVEYLAYRLSVALKLYVIPFIR